MRLQNKIALVTGAGGGNGAAMAAGMAREGAHVYFADLNLAGAEAQARAVRDAGYQAQALQLDVASAASVNVCFETIIKAQGRIDILINNAGICTRHHFLDLTEPEWDRMMQVNVKGVFLCGQAAARQMAKQKSGSIINVSSFSAYIAMPNTVHYGASKGAVAMATKHMALDLAEHGIRVNAISPGVIETDMNRERLAIPEQRAASLQRILVGRVGRPEDLVGAAVLLASDESGYMTGSTISIDGGWMVR
jgi:NAD(P)-dependent dehydrogenase (short-subunit alcohol dehydrogenase family)